MKEKATYPLRLPRWLKEAVERLSKEQGTSMNQFVALAVAERYRLCRPRTFRATQGASEFQSL
jgi:hypothetical protein